jgi:deoxyribodipyrimidine photo-lyase
MEKRFQRSLHIFRRDLRIEDNTALNAALRSSQEVYCAFFLDPRQVGAHRYRSMRALAFMLRSLSELSAALEQRAGRLYLIEASPESYLPTLIRQEQLQAIFFNRDYTPFSSARDREIYEIGLGFGVEVHRFADCLLHEPEEILTDKDRPYSVFTPFFRNWQKQAVKAVRPLVDGVFARKEIKGHLRTPIEVLQELGSPGDGPETSTSLGGRAQALVLLDSLERVARYRELRDFPTAQATTGLSAHLKFGTISACELFERVTTRFGCGHGLIAQLAWRDFFHHIGYHYPHVFCGPFKDTYAALNWREDPIEFERWCLGQTGFPIVDAGMRQLRSTGYMHNRVRMIVASFLTKDLLMNWRLGEQYFAQQLIDYDPCINNGNWQWASSTGCDAQPYFRVFNPWLQQEKFDADASYIKQWIPELRALSAREIHQVVPHSTSSHKAATRAQGYPLPMLDHGMARIRAQDAFESAKEVVSK